MNIVRLWNGDRISTLASTVSPAVPLFPGFQLSWAMRHFVGGVQHVDGQPLATSNVPPFRRSGVACRFRHRAIFSALDALRPGECMRFINDQDPLPLLEQLRQRFGEKLGIEYRQRESGLITIDFHVLG